MTLIVNVNPLISSLERSATRVDLATAAAASAGAEVFARFIRQELGKSTHGKRTKTESMPGEPPAKISGTLQRSVKVFVPKRFGPARYEGSAGPDEFYGRFHQTGTKHEPAHPFIEEAAHAAEASGLVHAACVKVWQAAAGI